MSNLRQERIITAEWLCNNRATCGRTNQTIVNTADFPQYVPCEIMVDCPHCGEVAYIWLGVLQAETRLVTVIVDTAEVVQAQNADGNQESVTFYLSDE